MRRRVEDVRVRGHRDTRDLDERHSAAGGEPERLASRLPQHNEVSGGKEVAGKRIEDDLVRWDLRQVVTDINPCRQSRSGPRHAEDVPRRRRCIEVITRIRDPGMMHVVRIDRDARWESRRTDPRGTGIHTGVSHSARRCRIDVVADEHTSAGSGSPRGIRIAGCSCDR